MANVDVGRDQMAPALAADARVTLMEGLNCRTLARSHLDGSSIEAIVCDVSFISLRLALPPALALAEADAWAVVLVKPQFEVGAAALNRNGLVRDPEAGEAVARQIATWLADTHGWHVDGLMLSPIAGGSGNRELLVGARKTGA